MPVGANAPMIWLTREPMCVLMVELLTYTSPSIRNGCLAAMPFG